MCKGQVYRASCFERNHLHDISHHSADMRNSQSWLHQGDEHKDAYILLQSDIKLDIILPTRFLICIL